MLSIFLKFKFNREDNSYFFLICDCFLENLTATKVIKGTGKVHQ